MRWLLKQSLRIKDCLGIFLYHIKQTACTIIFMIHIGKEIKTRLQQMERTPGWLAKKINCDRTNIYKIFQRASIDTELLSRISKALEHDFFIDLSMQEKDKCENLSTNV